MQLWGGLGECPSDQEVVGPSLLLHGALSIRLPSLPTGPGAPCTHHPNRKQMEQAGVPPTPPTRTTDAHATHKGTAVSPSCVCHCRVRGLSTVRHALRPRQPGAPSPVESCRDRCADHGLRRPEEALNPPPPWGGGLRPLLLGGGVVYKREETSPLWLQLFHPHSSSSTSSRDSDTDSK